jgi:hypothetical protein
MNFYGSIKLTQGDVRSLLPYGLEALHLAEQTGDPVLIGAVHDGVIWPHALLGNFGAVQEGYMRAAALLRDDPASGTDFYGISPLLSVRNLWLYALVWMGRFGEAEREARRSREVAKQHQQLDILCYMEAGIVFLARLGGNITQPLDHARNAIELAEQIGNAGARVFASWALGMAHGLAEDWSASIATLESGVTLGRGNRAGLFIEPMLLTALAESYVGAGDLELAQARASEALRLAEQRGTRTLEIEAQLAVARARCAEGVSARPAVEAALERALALIRETGARGFEPQVYLERATLARLSGDEIARDRELREALRLFVEMDATGHAERIALLLAESVR